MAIATFEPIVALLKANGVVHKDAGDYDVLDVAKDLDVAKGHRPARVELPVVSKLFLDQGRRRTAPRGRSRITCPRARARRRSR
ncbi:MAG: hypothetical protein QOI78_5647 [Actinomycetota bacterium]|nr:hypothetical protein [Actinomycetota bacterium]